VRVGSGGKSIHTSLLPQVWNNSFLNWWAYRKTDCQATAYSSVYTKYPWKRTVEAYGDKLLWYCVMVKIVMVFMKATYSFCSHRFTSKNAAIILFMTVAENGTITVPSWPLDICCSEQQEWSGSSHIPRSLLPLHNQLTCTMDLLFIRYSKWKTGVKTWQWGQETYRHTKVLDD